MFNNTLGYAKVSEGGNPEGLAARQSRGWGRFFYDKLTGHGTSPLEIRAEVKKGRGNDVSIDQEQSDQETAYPAVAVQEWMDRLELRVRQRRVDQRRQVLVMQKLLPIAETLHQLRGRRRHVGGVTQYASRRTGSVLAAPELGRRGRVAANAAHQALVYFSDQAERQGKNGEALDPILESGYVVAHLVQVGRTSLDGGPGLGGQELAKRRLRSLYATGKDRLPT